MWPGPDHEHVEWSCSVVTEAALEHWEPLDVIFGRGVRRHIDASIVSSFAVVSASSAEGTDAGTSPAPA
ncbi:MAG: hypothetical protein QOE59_2858 [Actinomycetota bacterium]|nr:hypothetical protein [Actinomycetota bacterium]